MHDTTDYSLLDYRTWTPLQRLLRGILRVSFKVLGRVEVAGLSNIPLSGPFIIVSNHLHVLDGPVGISIIPRRIVVFAGQKWRTKPVSGWFLRHMGNAIFTKPSGDVDYPAFRNALLVLKHGGVLGITPEGRRSKIGGLEAGHLGAVTLAARASVPIVPMVMYGQEQATAYWRRLRRVPISVRFGTPIEPSTSTRDKQLLKEYHDKVMNTLAKMLPSEYRGMYQSDG
jgi:1-acyl-sn-glycerol-3-phosphate acyltransferase